MKWSALAESQDCGLLLAELGELAELGVVGTRYAGLVGLFLVGC